MIHIYETEEFIDIELGEDGAQLYALYLQKPVTMEQLCRGIEELTNNWTKTKDNYMDVLTVTIPNIINDYEAKLSK